MSSLFHSLLSKQWPIFQEDCSIILLWIITWINKKPIVLMCKLQYLFGFSNLTAGLVLNILLKQEAHTHLNDADTSQCC